MCGINLCFGLESLCVFLIPIKYICNYDTLLVNRDLCLQTIYNPTTCQGSLLLVNWSSLLWVLGLIEKRIFKNWTREGKLKDHFKGV